MRRRLMGLIVSVVMAVSLPLSVRCQAPSLAELLPADSLGYVELPELEVFYYLISELGEAALSSLEEEQDFPEDIKVKGRAVLEAFNEIKPLLPRSGSLGIVSVDPQRGQPSIVFAAELSEGLAPLAAAASKLLPAAPNLNIKETEFGYEVVIPDAPIPPIGVAVKDNVLYAASGEGLLDQMLSRPSTGTLAQTARFKEVNGVIGENDIVSGYLNLEAILKQLMPILPDQAMQVVEILGLKEVQAAGLSVSANEELVGFNLALQYVKDAPGIASLLSLPNSKPKGMEYVPADYSYAVRMCLGPPDQQLKNVCAMLEKAGMGQQIAARMAYMKENMGIDVEKILASLGGEITLGVKIPETLGIPNVVMCIEARDPDYLMGLIKNLLGGEQGPMTVTEMELGGKKTMMLTPKMPIPVNPALAVDEDVIVMGISTAVLQKALAAKANGQNIADKPSFKAAMEGLPADSNVGLMYLELDGLGQLAMAGMGMAMSQVPSEIKPMLAKAMPYVARSVQNLGAATRATYRTPNGLAVQSRMGTPAVMGLLKNGAALAVKAFMLRGSRAEEVEAVATEALAVEEIPAERIEGEFTE